MTLIDSQINNGYPEYDDSFLNDTTCITSSNIQTWSITPGSNVILGEDLSEKHKIYIVEPWQSRKPIKVKEGLWISLEHDLIPNDEIKREIINKIEEMHPDIIIRAGINHDNIKLVKSEVNIEINKEF